MDGISCGIEQAVFSLLSPIPTLSSSVFISYRCVLTVWCGTGAMRDKSPGVWVLRDTHNQRDSFLLCDLLEKNPLVTMETTLSLAVIVTLTQCKGQG